MLALLALMLAPLQEAPADAAARAVERQERAVKDLENSLVELGEAGIPAVRRLQEHPKPEVREASGRALERIGKLAPEIMGWAFNLPRGRELRKKWKRIPVDTDILVTHGPPAGILDRSYGGESVGCADLRETIKRVKPKLHVFGHIHKSHGSTVVSDTQFVNASICNEDYMPSNTPIVIDL